MPRIVPFKVTTARLSARLATRCALRAVPRRLQREERQRFRQAKAMEADHHLAKMQAGNGLAPLAQGPTGGGGEGPTGGRFKEWGCLVSGRVGGSQSWSREKRGEQVLGLMDQREQPKPDPGHLQR